MFIQNFASIRPADKPQTKKRRHRPRKDPLPPTVPLRCLLAFLVLVVTTFGITLVHRNYYGGATTTLGDTIRSSSSMDRNTTIAPTMVPTKAAAASELKSVNTTTNDETKTTPAVVPFALPAQQQEQRTAVLQQILLDADIHQENDDDDDDAHKRALEWMTARDESVLLESVLVRRAYGDQDALVQIHKSILQRYALVVFYFATHPPVLQQDHNAEVTTSERSSGNTENDTSGTALSTTWMTSDHICAWDGIECEFQDDDYAPDGSITFLRHEQSYRRILHILLGDQGLEGRLPAIFVQHIVPELLQLDLKNNRLTGPLPSMIRPNDNSHPPDWIVPLELLSLHNNSLTGTIPNDFMGATTTHLFELDLSFNLFQGNPFVLSKEVAVDNNNLDDHSMLRMWNLRRLYLNDNALTGSVESMVFPENIGTLEEIGSPFFF